MKQLAVVKGKGRSVCPAYDGDRAHVGGPCITGSSTVYFESNPVCRVGDKLRCNSPNQDRIAGGNTAGVFIEGRLAAVTGSSTAHGGKIVVGGCVTIFIG